MSAKSFLKRQKKKLKKRFDYSAKGRVNRVIDNPPPIEQDSIVFTSSVDYSGNPKALFLYMIDHGYNEKYRMTWIFEHPENLFEFDIPNVKSVCMFNDKHERTVEAQKAIMSARYIFYSHNVNWCKKFREGQKFIDLWHGGGYKGELVSDKRRIYFDHFMVTGKKDIEAYKKFLRAPDGDLLDLGYPRNEMLFSNRSEGRELLKKLIADAGAGKSIIWLPTFRKSNVARLSTDTFLGDTDLPILYYEDMIKVFDDFCREQNVLLIVKQHFLQSDYRVSNDGLTNIMFLKDEFLRDNNADFYEFMADTDALITDYSSVAIDYMLLDKPIGFTLDDYDKYEDVRGWAYDDVKAYMPGHHIYTMEDLKQFVIDVAEDKDPHKKWRGEITDELHTYKDGFSKRILDYFGI